MEIPTFFSISFIFLILKDFSLKISFKNEHDVYTRNYKKHKLISLINSKKKRAEIVYK